MHTAYHEAGHVLAYLHFNLPFKYVTVEKHDSTLGHVYGENKAYKILANGKPLTAKEKDYIEKRLIILLSGKASQSFFKGKTHNLGCDSDFMLAGEILMRMDIVGKASYHYARFLYETALLLVSREDYWKFIKSLVCVLVEEKTMQYSACKELYSNMQNM